MTVFLIQKSLFYHSFIEYLERAEILCGKLGPRNTKITSRLNALYKEIKEEGNFSINLRH